LKHGSLKVWDVVGQIWRDVNRTNRLTASTYFYDIQAMTSLSKISERAQI
jgi:hypothetical protein